MLIASELLLKLVILVVTYNGLNDIISILCEYSIASARDNISSNA